MVKNAACRESGRSVGACVYEWGCVRGGRGGGQGGANAKCGSKSCLGYRLAGATFGRRGRQEECRLDLVTSPRGPAQVDEEEVVSDVPYA